VNQPRARLLRPLIAQTANRMPELPEVNTFQRYLDRTSLRQRIVETRVQDDKIIRNLDGATFEEWMSGRTITGSYRQGKYLFADLDNGHSVLLHFGMTGDLQYYSDEDDRPRFERFAFLFDNGYRLGFDCPRKFAQVLYLEDRQAYLEDIRLGDDALRIAPERFLELAKGRKSALKGFLMNQRFLAGIGNLYADEICYQARIHPASTLDQLNEAEMMRIFQKMKTILQYAVDRNAYYKDYPDDWLWQWREEGRSGPEGWGKVKKIKVAGRTTYFCEGWQALKNGQTSA